MSSKISLGVPKPAPHDTELGAGARGARLSGISRRLDPRVNACRADLADVALSDRVFAARYTTSTLMQCRTAAAPLCADPSHGAARVSELLCGEGFAVFDWRDEWAWGQCAADGYVGWVQAALLVPCDARPTHAIAVAEALVFAAASIKAPVLTTLPLGAAVAVDRSVATFLHVPAWGGWLHRRFVEPPAGDPASLAHDFLGTPYGWGGRTRHGIDCSGLIQSVLRAHGVACPRDSDQQLAAFPPVPFDQRQRGDLVGFPGHIGILVDADHLLHANAYWMTTCVEPLDAVIARLAGGPAPPVSGVVRPPCSRSGVPL